jgi:hypothetical protein
MQKKIQLKNKLVHYVLLIHIKPKNMKQIATIFTLAVALSLFMVSCNNKTKPVEDKPVAEVKDTVKPKPVFTPYKAMIVEHTVKDFDKWADGFNSTDSIRKAGGLTESAVGRGLDNDKWVIVFSVAPDIQKARDFGASPALKDAMKKAGVTGKPTVSYVDVIRDDTTSIPQSERLMVRHHVKDFDTWVKAYDAEGLPTRATYGLVDRGMTRDIDDPNTVTLLFAITDMEKAKARVASPELKKIMTDGGVDGKPEITYFKWLN